MQSSKIAIAKISIGVVVAALLIVVFACEQKESMDSEPVVEKESMSMHGTFMDGKLKIDATSETLEKLKDMFSENSGFEIIKDSLGNTLLVKKEVAAFKKLETNDEIFNVVEEMPEFPGGDQALRKYIANHVNYPEQAQKEGLQGKVYVTFVVSKDGSIANCGIARGVSPVLDKEALRVINGLPRWKPGKQKGQAVNVQYTVPINFRLQ